MFPWRAAVPVCVVGAAMSLVAVALGCGGGKPPDTAAAAAGSGPQGAARGNGKAGDWCDPMPQPDDTCKTELKECMVTCDYISDRCALLVCMGSKWTYVEEQDESSAAKP